MIKIDVRVDIKAATRFLNDLQRKQIPFATALALTRTAQKASLDLKGELRKVLDKPTPYTLGGTFHQGANKTNLRAIVGLKDKASSGRAAGVYLRPLIAGIPRKQTGWEKALQSFGAIPAGMRAVPGEGAKLDRYGNIDRKQMAEMMGTLRSRMRTFKGRGKRAHAIGYFAALPGDPRARHLKPGIYQRIERGGGSVLKPVVVFVSGTNYRPTIRLHDTVKRTVEREFAGEFGKAMSGALATAR